MPIDKEIFGDLEAPKDRDIFADEKPRAVKAPALTPSQPEIKTPRVASWANQAIAALPDALLNTPTNLFNLAKAGVGTAATAVGRPDLAPGVTQTPDLVRRAFEQAGLIKPELDPTTTEGRLAKAAVQGLTMGPLAPAQTAKQMLVNSAISGGSAVTGQGVTEATGNPLLGTAAAIAAAPALGAGYNAWNAADRQAAQRNAVADDSARVARDANYVAPPSALGSNSWLMNLMESIGGKAAIKQEATRRNAENTTRLAAEENNLPPSIRPNDIPTQRRMAAAPYEEARKLEETVYLTPARDPKWSTKQPLSQAVDDLVQAKKDVNDSGRAYKMQGGTDLRIAWESAKERVASLEQRILDAAVAAGKPDLADRIRAARTQISKLHMAEEGINPATGQVSAKPYGEAYRDNPNMLTGNSAIIGRTYNRFPMFMGDAERNPAAGVNNLMPMASTGLGMQGANTAGLVGAVAGGLPLLGRPVRSLLLSQYIQNRMQPTYPLLVSDPFLRGILASQFAGEQ
jgi:hypothetical protein